MIRTSRYRDIARCFGLIILSLILLPLSISIVSLCLVSRAFYDEFHQRSKNRLREEFSEETVLITGVGMAKGLTLARAFYMSGHRVIGADNEGPLIPCPGRYSRSLSGFYGLPKSKAKISGETYNSRLIDVIRIEDVKIWVSCSGVANAIQDAQAMEAIERNTSCKCIQFDPQITSTLHEKGLFMEECENLGLSIPETHRVESKYDAFRILSICATLNPKRKYILKPVGMDDLHRGRMTILPLDSEGETKSYISQLPISDLNPWILQQYIPGGREYCTHALIIRGAVRCFVACPSSDFLMHYELLQDSSLWKAMLAFTVEFVQRSPRPEAITGHLSFDFMTSEEDVNHDGFRRHIYAIECNPRAHTAVVLFGQRGPEAHAMVQAYLSLTRGDQEIIAPDPNSKSKLLSDIEEPIVTPSLDVQPRYWIGHDLVSLFLRPIFQRCTRSDTSKHAVSRILEFISHLLLWKEGTFEVWDPLPALILNHVYWPMTILSAWWRGNSWSRINVSTTKMFAC
ncbi:hypothetical protein F5Y11DRAFT_38895 [Daldinia sp. FL1419]|nr:hypothetical protein F5Y11DRAFT_38895 [Daldinia sp. FL1419]